MGKFPILLGWRLGVTREKQTAKIDELMNFSHEARWLWVALKAFGSRYVASSVKFYCPLKVYGRQHSSESKFYDFSSFSLLVKKSLMMTKIIHEICFNFSWRTCGQETADKGPSKAAEGIEEGEVYQWVSVLIAVWLHFIVARKWSRRCKDVKSSGEKFQFSKAYHRNLLKQFLCNRNKNCLEFLRLFLVPKGKLQKKLPSLVSSLGKLLKKSFSWKSLKFKLLWYLKLLSVSF